ncbi:MAG TPA: SDR family NAD(P)-dependent oxidoreductase [Acidimicrobiales bacterium]|nr:SDR family NAD(P)-dependent oxidoreductase [Acidimicrobiales bacterium]
MSARPVALVTGSSSGMGQAAAQLFAARGYDLVVNYSHRADGAEATAKAVEAAGGRAVVVRCDVSDEAAVLAMVESCRREYARLDVLVNAAGTTTSQPPRDLSLTTMDEWDRIMAVNVKGLFLVTRACTALLGAATGSVVNLGSLAGVRPTGVQPYAYAASKGAVATLTKLLAANLAPAVRVNAVLPGWVEGTWMQEQLGDDYERLVERRAKHTPLRRVASNDDVAETIFAVATSMSFVTGQLVAVDGGYSSTT